MWLSPPCPPCWRITGKDDNRCRRATCLACCALLGIMQPHAPCTSTSTNSQAVNGAKHHGSRSSMGYHGSVSRDRQLASGSPRKADLVPVFLPSRKRPERGISRDFTRKPSNSCNVPGSTPAQFVSACISDHLSPAPVTLQRFLQFRVPGAA